MPDMSYVSLCNAEQVARDETYEPGLLGASESLFCVPPNPIVCQAESADDVACFRPRDCERLFVLSGCAGMSRAHAAELLKPAALSERGNAAGAAVAAEAARLPALSAVHVPDGSEVTSAVGEIRECNDAVRGATGMLERPPSAPGILADVDVVVVGGGTAGAAAAIAAARHGVRTLVIEYQSELGGMGTVGMIGSPYHGRAVGFAVEVPYPKRAQDKMEWYRSELRKAGGMIWTGVMATGALVEGERVAGVVTAMPEGSGIVQANVIIDATGNADVAIHAGADYIYGALERDDLAMQGVGLPTRAPGLDHNNTDYLLADDADMLDVWRTFVSVQLRDQDKFDVGTLIQTRERRNIVGDFVMRYVDQIAGRTYPDSVVLSASDYDTHGYPSSPLFALLPHDEKSRAEKHPAPGGECYTPYRCLLPRGLEGILVIGIGISIERDACALVRMQYDLANQGYAAGVAAAMAVQEDVTPRQVDVRQLQAHLVEKGCLPESVLIDQDSFPLAAEDVDCAVEVYGAATNPETGGQALAIIMSHHELALPLLRKAYERAEGAQKARYGQMLAVLGEQSVAPTLISALETIAAWDDKIYQGRMAEYGYLPTPIDSLVLALGYAGDCAALPEILRLLEKLDAQTTLSHHRSVALALERLGDPSAAAPLAALLHKPGMRGFALTELPRGDDVEHRTESLREITLARALYHCGDCEGLGRTILEEYSCDLRGLFARHAQAVLSDSAQRDAQPLQG
jgi:hypothetical protein